MNETKAPRDKSLKSCACSAFYAIETIDGEQRVHGTGCVRQTNNLFAQGHDAKLVSFLVKADLSSDQIYWYSNGKDHQQKGATEAAANISQALAAKTERALVNALDRLAARRTPKAKAEPKPPREPKVTVVDSYVPAADPEVEARKVTGKVGRWQYEGTELTTGAFNYRTNSGESKTAEAGKWTKIEK